MFGHIVTHQVLSKLSLDSLTTIAHLIPHLKRDILQPQPPAQSDAQTAPTRLSSSLTVFLGGVVGIHSAHVTDLWDII